MRIRTTAALVAFTAAACAISGIATEAAAQAYPGKPVRFIVPFPPGTGVDILTRVISQKLGERWGQTIVADNRAGAGGGVGTALASKAPPDGYTLLMGNLGTHALNPHLYKSLPYDPLRDFAPVTQVASVPMMLVVHPNLPVASVRSLITLARSKPGELNYGSAGIGSAGHLSGELLASLAKIKLVHVAYKGNQQALTDLMVGQVQITFGNLLSMLPHTKSGRVRGLAVTSMKRSTAAPDVPTMLEAGVPEYVVTQWYGVFAPAQTPKEIVGKLHHDIVEVLKLPDVRTRIIRDGADVIGDSPDEFVAHIKSENARWAKVIQAAGVQPQ